MAKVLDYEIVVRNFDFQLRYYVHFRIKSLGKGMKPIISQAMSVILSSTVS